MDVITPERLLVMLAFLAVLLGLWAAARVYGNRLPGVKQGPAARIDIAAVKSLGDGSRAILLQVAGTEVLVLTQRRAAPAILHLPKVQP
jgi:hypothetical protein